MVCMRRPFNFEMSSTRLVAIREGAGWFLFRFWGVLGETVASMARRIPRGRVDGGGVAAMA